ncbi:MAG: endonuclease III [Spirochaetes bacterium]|nr:endonuclease III [Spirochaetota bacterium]
MNVDINNIEYVLKILKNAYKKSKAPSVTLIADTTGNPFNILISTLISLRTKDEVTIQSSKRLFEKAKSFYDIKKIPLKDMEKLIYPAGFYKVKSARIKQIADIITEKYNGKIPDDIDELLKLPGVGRKTANLVVALGFNKPGLCVDTHVHRITNRFGWVKTKNPFETEMALRKFLPVKYWEIINNYLVSYGQTVCKPISPFCSLCKLNEICPKNGVTKSR